MTTPHFIHFDSLDSTNDWAKANLSTFSYEKITVITADMQTHGHGQFGRPWYSPNTGNLYLSYCFFLPTLPVYFPLLAYVSSLITANLLEQFYLPPLSEFSVKWPNDLYLDNRKLGGILVESIEHNGKYAIILGIGLNINAPIKEISEINGISLKEAIPDKTFDVLEIKYKLVHELQSRLCVFLQNGFSEFYQISQRLFLPPSYPLCFLYQKIPQEGKLLGLAKSGNLIFESSQDKLEVKIGSLLK